MALLELPIRTDIGKYNFRAPLDGITYTFRFRWNTRATAWFMDIKDVNDTPLVMGVKIVLNIELLASFKHLAIPQGTMLAVNLENENQAPTRDNFGTEIRLVYNEAP